jgi:hypothetical protein
MNTSLPNVPSRVEVTLPESCRIVLAEVCKAEGLTPEEAVNKIVNSVCQGLKEQGLGKGTDVSARMDFLDAKRRAIMRRSDEILSVIEGLILDSRALTSALTAELNRRISRVEK